MEMGINSLMRGFRGFGVGGFGSRKPSEDDPNTAGMVIEGAVALRPGIQGSSLSRDGRFLGLEAQSHGHGVLTS